MITCRICNNFSGNKSFVAREMMLGYKDEFEYFECANCGCLQIKEIPENLSKYYPQDYYSFRKQHNLSESAPTFLRIQLPAHLFYGKNIFGKILSRICRTPSYYEWLRIAGVKPESGILDVGCGSGDLLNKLQNVGFLNLIGIDPYIEDNIFYENGVKVYKKEIYQVEGQFDFIMAHHSFEHMQNPLSIFRELYRLLKPDRYALIRIPVASSYCWRKYTTNWVQLDAPRHLFLHTAKSIQILAEQVGMKIANITYDSTKFQFWGSEQYSRDIALCDENSYSQNPEKSVFSKTQIRAFKKKTVELNKNRDGDSACFYLYKS